MKYEDAQLAVDKYTAGFLWLLQIQEWDVQVNHNNFNGERTAGDVVIDLDYRRATIRLDYTWADDEEELLGWLFHECIHILVGQYELFKTCAFQHVEGAGLQALKRIWVFAMERTIVSIEHAFKNGVGKTAKEVSEAGLEKAAQAMPGKYGEKDSEGTTGKE